MGTKIADGLQCRQVRGHSYHQQKEAPLFGLHHTQPEAECQNRGKVLRSDHQQRPILEQARRPCYKEGNSTIGFLKRNMRSAPQAAKDTAYKTFVRPIVEYAATAWAPSTDKANDKIDMVQRRAARFVKNDYGRTSSVTEMISNLGWDTLQKRRDLARLSMMYRIVHELVDIPVEPYLIPLTSMTRGHDSRFHQIRTSNTTYQFSSQEPSSYGTNSVSPQ